MRIVFDKYLAQSSKNDNINRNNSKTQPPSHHYYLLYAYYVQARMLGALFTLCQ